MRRRQITIDGGRYLIFYSFEDEQGLDAAPSTGATATRAGAGAAGDDQPAREPALPQAVEPAAEGERRV
ncbi:MAG: hypothetical protein LC785_03775 [Acidobacteria bacterium]|nr:hypothetical protein [Acidobacteriota bacterium]MCA1641102.1 hypothetical protein [Acidobacteriota bacterium]